jgi:hypothetical protein
MGIYVTPIPKLTEFATPAFTLGTANAAGVATSTVRTDATLLTFDTTAPADVNISAVVGSAVTAPRRDHQHAGGSGASKLWAKVNASDGALGSPSFNCASTGRDSAGVYTVTISSDMGGTTYASWASVREPVSHTSATSNWAAGTYKVRGFQTTDQAAVDIDFSTGVFGDLA